jgi:NitT/TauT family transport system substrate-binding protein
MQRRAFVSALGAASIAAPAAAQSRTSLKLGLIPADFSAQAYVARENGYFDRQGLDVEITAIGNGAAIQAALVAGALDIGYSNVLALALARARGLAFEFVLPSNYYRHDEATVGVIGVARTGPIVAAKDLESKTIAVSGINEIATLAVRRWMDANGADATKCRFLELPFPAMAAAVTSGRVDAASLNLALAPTAGTAGDPIRILTYSYDAIAPRWVISAWCATSDWIAAHGDVLARFTLAMQQATAWANAHHADTTRILAAALDRPAASIEALPRPTYETKLSAALLQPGIDVAARYGAIPTAFPASELLAPALR